MSKLSKEERRKAKKLNRRLGRTKTIKAANRNRGRGTSKARSQNTSCRGPQCTPKGKGRGKSKVRTGRNRVKKGRKTITTNQIPTIENINETPNGTNLQRARNPRFL